MGPWTCLVLVLVTGPQWPVFADHLQEEYERIDANITQILNEIRRRINKEIAPIIQDVIYDPRLPSQCAGSLLKLGLGVQNLEMWAIEMIDAIGKPPSGALRGRIGDYGSYDECLNVRHPRGAFGGRYCMLHLMLKPTPIALELAEKFMDYHGMSYVGNFSRLAESAVGKHFPAFKLGMCIPSTCEQEDLQLIIDNTILKYGLILQVNTCKVNEPIKIDERQHLILWAYGVWLSLILAGTMYDVYQRKVASDELTKPEKPGLLSNVARSFSLVRNTRKLTSISSRRGETSELGIIHGVRALSALWVVLGHSYIFMDPHNDGGLMYLWENVHTNFMFSVQMNTFLAVESFFTMTGFLMSYLAVNNYHKDAPILFVVPMTLFRRYIRLVMPMLVVLSVMYLLPLIMSGPLLEELWPTFDKSCGHTWWWVATMTHNYHSVVPEYCMPHYWYVSADFQLIICTSLLLTVLPRWPKPCLIFTGAVALVGTVYTTLHTYLGDYYPTALVLSTDVQKLFDTGNAIYFKPYSHIAPVALGVMFGWFAVQRHQLSRTLQAVGWAAATLLGFTCLFSIWSWNSGWDPTGPSAVLYGGLHRTAWSLVICWLLYICVTGRGGPVSKILDWPPFYALGRLSFGLYLIHAVVLVCNIMAAQDRKAEQPFLQIQYFFGAAAMSYFLAYLLYIIVEAPVGHLDNLLFSFTKRYQKSSVEKRKKDVEDNYCNAMNGIALSNGKPRLSPE